MRTCCVVGLGYIGLPTAAVLAHAGHRVIGADVNAQVVSTVNEGRIHIVEPDLEQAVAAAVASGSLSAQVTPVLADVFLIAVPTPFRSGVDGIPQPNIDYVLAAARACCCMCVFVAGDDFPDGQEMVDALAAVMGLGVLAAVHVSEVFMFASGARWADFWKRATRPDPTIFLPPYFYRFGRSDLGHFDWRRITR